MEILLTVGAYVWTGYCAVSHINIGARKRGEPCTWKEQSIGYVVLVPIYWLNTFLILWAM